jgi:hypothetical protein
MPHYKCEACRGRLHGASGLTELVGDLCPECGEPLVPAGELSELVGFRMIAPHGELEDERGAREVTPVADLVAHGACREQARLDSERWSDDGLVALEVALPHPEALR